MTWILTSLVLALLAALLYIRRLSSRLDSARTDLALHRATPAVDRLARVERRVLDEAAEEIEQLTRERDAARLAESETERALLDATTQLAMTRERCAELERRVPRETSASIAAWARDTFGEAPSNLSIWQRADKEFQELRAVLEANDSDPKAAKEACDVAIVLDRLIHRLGGDLMHGRDAKMTTNRGRRWQLTGDGHGQHIEEPQS